MTLENDPTPLRVLVVDDEYPIAFSLAHVLERAGYEAKTARNGDEALVMAAEFRPDVLLTDFSMPGLNGFELAVATKRLLPGCRVVLLSGHQLQAPADPYAKKGYSFLMLSKPLHPESLLSALQAEMPENTEPRRLKVLHVDDTESHRYSVSRLLTHAGFEVCDASTGAEAIAKAADQSPDLILLDVNLPDMNGFEVCRRLKQNPETATMTIVHLTASSTNQESAEQSVQVGADGFLTEPFVPAELIARLRSFLQLRYLSEDPSFSSQ